MDDTKSCVLENSWDSVLTAPLFHAADKIGRWNKVTTNGTVTNHGPQSTMSKPHITKHVRSKLGRIRMLSVSNPADNPTTDIGKFDFSGGKRRLHLP